MQSLHRTSINAITIFEEIAGKILNDQDFLTCTLRMIQNTHFFVDHVYHWVHILLSLQLTVACIHPTTSLQSSLVHSSLPSQRYSCTVISITDQKYTLNNHMILTHTKSSVSKVHMISHLSLIQLQVIDNQLII
jgi:hypothetical protein